MKVGRVDEHGDVGYDLVDVLCVGFLAERIKEKAATEDANAIGIGSASGDKGLLYLSNGLAQHIDLVQGTAEHDEVSVPVDDSRENDGELEIDNVGVVILNATVWEGLASRFTARTDRLTTIFTRTSASVPTQTTRPSSMSMASCRVSAPELVKILPLMKSLRGMVGVRARVQDGPGADL